MNSMVRKRKYTIKTQWLKLSTLLFILCLLAQSGTHRRIISNIDKGFNDSDKYILSEDHHSSLHGESQYSDISHDPFQSPAEPTPTPNEPGEQDEKENTDNDEWSKIHFIFYCGFDFAFKSSTVSFAQFEQNVLKRTKISLVVLHHSWKSFPA